MRAKTTVAQVALVGGGRYDQPSNMLVDERAPHFAKGRNRGNLYILVDVSGPAVGRHIVAGQVTEAMRAAYHNWRGSVTAGLQQAVREANNLLFDENRNSLPGERWTAGVSCVVLRDDDLFIAQAGPAAVYLAHGEQVNRYPDLSPWLDDVPFEEMDVAPLGDRRDPNIALFHGQVSSGDTFLLTDSQLARRVPPQTCPVVLTRTPVDAVLEELLVAGGGIDLSALVVRLAEEGVERVPARISTPDHVPERPRGTSQPVWEQLSQWVTGLHIGDRLRVVGQTLAGALVGFWVAFLNLLKRMVPSQLGPMQPTGRQAPAVKKMGKRTTKQPKGRKADAAQSDLVQRTLIGVAVAIPLIVAAIVLVTLVQRGQARKAELETLWQQANGRWEQARLATDQAASRALLTEADGFLDQLLERRPDDAGAVELRSKVQAQLDLINRVQRISEVGELNTYPEDADLTRVVVQGVHIFVMDRRSGQVYHHQLDEQLQKALQPDSLQTVLVNRGQQVGNVVVGDLVDMVWMPTGPDRQRASLVILESNGTLLDYDPATGELLPLRVAAPETWQFPKLVGSHTGRFYLLDSSANRIWRYSPTLDGYSASPDAWLETEVDLTGVVDMAIGDSIYLLYANGTIQRLTTGQPDTFDIQDWDSPPRDPAAIFARPPDVTQWVYVADRGNSRIVQCSREGRFERQFRLADSQVAGGKDLLDFTTSLFVDEISGHAYLLSGRKLYLLVLPMPE